MERARLHLLLLIGLLALASIVCGEPTPTPTGPPAVENIGTIRRENTRVQYGTSLAQLAELTSAQPLLAESALRVTNGGEALLDFSAGLVVRAFNNANMSVALSTDPSPYLLRFYLERSVATGELAAAGEAISWETPNGAQITISGTEFFVAFDPVTDRTLVGNFNGTIDIAHASLPGGVAAIPGGEGYEIPGGPFTLPPGLTRARFESTLRGLSDPLDEPRSYPGTAAGQTVLFLAGGEPFSAAPMRSAMVQAVPWRDLIAEITGSDPDSLDLLLAQASTPTRTTSANELAYDMEAATATFQEFRYMRPPGDDVWLDLVFTIIAANDATSETIAGSAAGFYGNFGFKVDVNLVPAADFLDVVRTRAAAGETFWAVSVAPAR